MKQKPSSEEKEILDSELKKLASLRDVAHLPGIKFLLGHTKDAAISCVEQLMTGHVDKPEHELRTLCATLRANYELYRLMTGNEEKIKVIEEILNPTPA